MIFPLLSFFVMLFCSADLAPSKNVTFFDTITVAEPSMYYAERSESFAELPFFSPTKPSLFHEDFLSELNGKVADKIKPLMQKLDDFKRTRTTKKWKPENVLKTINKLISHLMYHERSLERLIQVKIEQESELSRLLRDMSNLGDITTQLHSEKFMDDLKNKTLSNDDIESLRANVLQEINAINVQKNEVIAERQKYIMGRNNFVQTCNPYHYAQRYHPNIFNAETVLFYEFGDKRTRPIPINS